MNDYFTDGSSTINVESAYCVVNGNRKIVDYEITVPYRYTNNEEEYRGVIAALKLCEVGSIIHSDSMLVVNQSNGIWRISKPHLVPYVQTVMDLLRDKKAKLEWIRRDINLAGFVFERKEPIKIGDFI